MFCRCYWLPSFGRAVSYWTPGCWAHCLRVRGRCVRLCTFYWRGFQTHLYCTAGSTSGRQFPSHCCQVLCMKCGHSCCCRLQCPSSPLFGNLRVDDTVEESRLLSRWVHWRSWKNILRRFCPMAKQTFPWEVQSLITERMVLKPSSDWDRWT